MARTARPNTWIAVVILLLIGGASTRPAAGQEARLSLERAVGAMCAKAEFDGDSYRPYVCDPRCDCLESTAIAMATNCIETAPGAFTALSVENVGPCGDVCAGGSFCYYSSSFAACNSSADCPPGEICDFLPPAGFNVCYLPCSTNADCPAISICEGSPLNVPCLSDADCLVSLSCNFSTNTCSPLSCTQDSDCFALTSATLTLTGVSGPDGPDPVTCSDSLAGTSEQVNSNDALECIAQIEAAIGQACTPFAP